MRWEQEIHPQGVSLLAYLQQLTRVRIRLAQYASDPQPSLLSDATGILAPLLTSAEENGWGGHVIEILLLQALIEQARGQDSMSQNLLTRAIILAEPAGYIRLFVDEGAAIQRLISEYRSWIAKEAHLEDQQKRASTSPVTTSRLRMKESVP